MGDFLRVLLEIIQFLWPGRKVMTWEEGCLYILGKYKKKLGPGTYWIIPWFMEIKEFSVVPGIVTTTRQDITLLDGSILHFAASLRVRVSDLALALNTIDSYQETTQELAMNLFADKLADMDAVRLQPENRRRLASDLRRAIANEAKEFGVEVSGVTFTTFVHKPRVIRLLTGTEVLGQGSSW